MDLFPAACTAKSVLNDGHLGEAYVEMLNPEPAHTQDQENGARSCLTSFLHCDMLMWSFSWTKSLHWADCATRYGFQSVTTTQITRALLRDVLTKNPYGHALHRL